MWNKITFKGILLVVAALFLAADLAIIFGPPVMDFIGPFRPMEYPGGYTNFQSEVIVKEDGTRVIRGSGWSVAVGMIESLKATNPQGIIQAHSIPPTL